MRDRSRGKSSKDVVSETIDLYEAKGNGKESRASPSPFDKTERKEIVIIRYTGRLCQRGSDSCILVLVGGVLVVNADRMASV